MFWNWLWIINRLVRVEFIYILITNCNGIDNSLNWSEYRNPKCSSIKLLKNLFLYQNKCQKIYSLIWLSMRVLMDINCGCATGKEDKILFPNAQFAWGKSEISSNSSLLCHSDSFNFTEKKILHVKKDWWLKSHVRHFHNHDTMMSIPKASTQTW